MGHCAVAKVEEYDADAQLWKVIHCVEGGGFAAVVALLHRDQWAQTGQLFPSSLLSMFPCCLADVLLFFAQSGNNIFCVAHA